MRAGLFNRLEEVAVSLAPQVARAKQVVGEAASEVAVMSGSGSAVYVLLDSAVRAAEVAERLRPLDVGQVFVAETERPGAEST